MFTSISSLDSLYSIASKVLPDIRIMEVQGSPTGVSCQVKDNVPTILWDTNFWNYVEQNIILRDTMPYELKNDLKLITEYFHNYHGILAYHLSKRYSDYPQIRAAFIQYANISQYSFFRVVYPKLAEVSAFKTQYEVEMATCRLMALYHELAHVLFQRDHELKSKLENLVVIYVKEYLSEVGEEIYEISPDSFPNRVTKDYLKSIYHQFVNKDSKYAGLVEEMAADLYALLNTYEIIFNDSEPSNYLLSSNAILSGIMVFYTYISSYERICSFWDAMIPLVLLKQYEVPEKIEEALKANEDFTVIRTQLYPSILFEVVHELDEIKWQPDRSIFIQSLNNALELQNINEEWSWRAFESINNPNIFKEVLCSANEADIKNGEYELYEIPEDILIITWMSNQYHNNKGKLFLEEENKPVEALKEFKTSILISERYLGTYHRHTARAYNNAVTALLELYEKSFGDNRFLVEAKHYSDTALNILKYNDSLSFNHLAQTYQNAGVIAQSMEDHEKAIEFFIKAKKEKYYLTGGEYEYSIVLTDSALAASYLFVGRKKEAKELCEQVLQFLSENNMEYDKYYSYTWMVYQMCEYV